MYFRWEALVSARECNEIIDEFKNAECEDAVIKGGGVVDMRCTSVHWVDPQHLLNRVMDSIMLEANSKYFNYSITGSERLQFATYGMDGKYDWHTDSLGYEKEPHRKLSTTLQLSPPEDYEGGDFEFFTGDKQEDLDLRKQGSVVVFDSRDWHRITPITKGVRHSLVMWSYGRKFV